jgi:hypothetical protein
MGFSEIYDATTRLTAKTQMEMLSPDDLIAEDIVVVECRLNRYYDMAKDGRIIDWRSNRVSFCMEAIYLLYRAPEKREDDAGTDDFVDNNISL